MFLLVFIAIFKISYTTEISSEFLRDFFIVKNVQVIEVNVCNNKGAIELSRKLTTYGFQIMSGKEDLETAYRRNTVTTRHGVYVDLSCDSGVDLIQKSSDLEVFNTSYTWLLWQNENVRVRQVIEKLSFDLTSDVTLAVSGAKSGVAEFSIDRLAPRGTEDDLNEIVLFDLHKVMESTPLLVMLIGRWSPDRGMFSYQAPSRKYNMGGRELKCGIFLAEKFLFKPGNLSKELQDTFYHRGHELANRLFYSINLHVADLYNYSISLKQADSYGAKIDEGIFDGIIGLLYEKSVMLSVTSLQITKNRMDGAGFTFPSNFNRYVFVFKQPRTFGSYRALTLQLKTSTWICLGCLLFISMFAYWCYQLICTWTNHPDGEPTFSAAATQIIGIISQQGLSHEPRRLSGRIACIFLLLLALVISVSYNSSTMYALLSPIPASIKNLQDLLISDIPLALIDLPYLRLEEPRKRILTEETHDKVTSRPNFLANFKDGLNLILKGGALCGEDFTLYTEINNKFSDNEKCDISDVLAHPPMPVGNYVAKHSQYVELLKRGYLRVKEHGLTHRQKNRWYPKRPSCAGSQVFLLVDFKTIIIALSIMIAGFFGSILVLIFEILNVRLKNYERRKIENPKNKIDTFPA